jgi:hypothetical protein
MSAAAVAAGVGTAFSIYSGISGGKDAKRERAQAYEMWQRNQAIGEELKAQEAPTQDLIQRQLGVFQGTGLTPEGQRAQDRLGSEFAGIQRNILTQAPVTGDSIAGGRMLTSQFAKAQGIAGLNLEDQINKRAQLGQWTDRASRVPGWVGVQTGVNADMAGQMNQWSNQDSTASASAYGEAARGLANLAMLYRKPLQAPSGGGNPGGSVDYSQDWSPSGYGADMSDLRIS